jgi:hypothetical protein
MSRFCETHPDEYADKDGKCYYCRELAAGLIDHDPKQTTAYNLDTTRKISWETLEARKQKEIVTTEACIVCRDDFVAKSRRQKTCGKAECKQEWHRRLSHKWWAKQGAPWAQKLEANA